MPKRCGKCLAWEETNPKLSEGLCSRLNRVTGSLGWCNDPVLPPRVKESDELKELRRRLKAKDVRIARHGDTGQFSLYWFPRCKANYILSGDLHKIKRFERDLR